MIFYENVLSNQNITARTNIVWVADITSVDLPFGKKLYIFLCLDIHSNKIISSTVSSRGIRNDSIVRSLISTIDKRFPVKPKKKVIIHTDRGSQFTSKSYNDFTKRWNDYMIPSMSRPSTPKDNSVAERFIRTFKNHKINGLTFQEEIFRSIELNPSYNHFRRTLNIYVKSINQTPNKKSSNKPPQRHDLNVSAASMLMVDPKYSKAFSERFGDDYRMDEINKFKEENSNVVSILTEIAAKKAELVNETPFDNYEDNLALQVIDQRLMEIYKLIQQNPDITREYVEEAVFPLKESMDGLHEKVNILLPKTKISRQVQPLRDPIDFKLLPIFLGSAGTSFSYQKDLKWAQLRIAYTILYYVGLRVNEIRFFTQQDIQNAIKSSQFNVVHFKTKQSHIHVISDQAVKDLKGLKLECDIVFEKYKYNYLFGKNKPVTKKHLIAFINRDLKHTCDINQIPLNIKSHSFRINMISSLLKVTTVQNAADIIGHDDINSTIAYKRYALNKTEIQELLAKISTDNSQP